MTLFGSTPTGWGPIDPPTPVKAAPTAAVEAVVVTLNPDGTVDCKHRDGRTVKIGVAPPAGVTLAIGDRVALADLHGDAQKPAIVQVLSGGKVGNLADNSVAAAQIVDGSVTFTEAAETLLGLLAGHGKRKLNYGTANLSYAASATTTTSTTVPHGLGVVPVFAVAMTSNFAFSEGGPDIIGTSPAPDATNCVFWGRRALAVPAGGLTVPFFWAAIG